MNNRNNNNRRDRQTIVEYEVIAGPAPVRDDRKNDPDEEFWPMNGDREGTDAEQPYSNFGENLRAGIKNIAANMRKRKNTRVASKADARVIKAKAKLTGAQANVQAAKALGKPDAPVTNIVQKQKMSDSNKSKGMGTGAKVGIAIGVVAVLGIITYVLIKKHKKGKK